MPQLTYALEVDGVAKNYAATRAVDSLSFTVKPGEIFGLLGPNGAGKTTTIRMILDIIKPSAGRISVLGGPMAEATKARIGYLPEERGLYEDMTVLETLLFLGQLKGLSYPVAQARADAYLREVALDHARGLKVKALSRGMNQKVQFVAATMHEPDLIIVDEPFSGLDPVNTRVIKNLIYRMRDRGAAIVMSTHQMHQVEAMCERILLIDHGRQVLYGPVGEIRRQFAGNAVEVTCHGSIGPLPGVEQLAVHDSTYRLRLPDELPPEELLRTLVTRPGVTVQRFESVQASLEEIFVQLVGHNINPAEAAE